MPQLTSDQPGLRLWHKLDQTFRVPRANAYFLLHSPAAYDSPRAAALTHLTLKLLEVCLDALPNQWCVKPSLAMPAWAVCLYALTKVIGWHAGCAV